ncbi:DUF4136 domain-containing protein [Lysobacter sp. TAF61]|uniref:DUF4136 domain-containing protein n=1 Tax=Lysobacter sp. TAF61 TaxID=3233072 RepID=UPI003F9431B8
MKRSLILFVAMGIAMLSGCATTPAVFTDYDPGVSFGQYRTYRWAQKPEGYSPLEQQRLVAAVDAKLRERGWTQSTEAQIDIVANVATETRYSLDSFYSGPAWGGWGWGGGWGGWGCCGGGWGWGASYGSTTTRAYTYGTLVLDMFDSQSKRAIWRGIAQGTIPSNPQRQTTNMLASVDKMFATFPPGTPVAQAQ